MGENSKTTKSCLVENDWSSWFEEEMTPLGHPAAAPGPESSVTLRQTCVSVWAPARLSYVCATGEPGGECFLCLPELRPIILEAGGTLGLWSWARVLDFQNSYIQQIQGLFLESSSKPRVVAGSGNAEDSQVLVLWSLRDKFNNNATLVLWWKRDKSCLNKSWGAT